MVLCTVVVAIATVVVAVATFWYAYSAHKQWEIMTSQLEQMKAGSAQTESLLNETKKLAIAGKEQAESLKAQARNMKDLAERALTQAKATNALASAAKKAAKIAEAQQASPWVGIVDQGFEMKDPNYNWSSPNPPEISFQATFSVKNFGNAPALHYTHTMTSAPVSLPLTFKEWEGQGSQPNVQTCPLSEPQSKIDEYRKGGSMILPGETRMQVAGSAIRVDPKPRAIGVVWTTLCITYFGPTGPLHHSGYVFTGVPDFKPPISPITFPDHPGWAYLRQMRQLLVGSNAN